MCLFLIINSPSDIFTLLRWKQPSGGMNLTMTSEALFGLSSSMLLIGRYISHYLVVSYVYLNKSFSNTVRENS